MKNNQKHLALINRKLKEQSLSHIYLTHSKDICCARRILYKYIDNQVLTAWNIDLPRKVKNKPIKKNSENLRKSREYRNGKPMLILLNY